MARAYIPIQTGNVTLQYSVPGTNPIEPTTIDQTSVPPLPTFSTSPVAGDGFIGCIYVVDSAGRMRFDYDIVVDRTVWFINSITVTPPDTDPYDVQVVVLGGPPHTG